MQQSYGVHIKKEGDEVKQYKRYEQTDFAYGEDIIGLDANILVDLVESEDFKKELREQINFNVSKIYTTNIALGEARHVLEKYRGYTRADATNKLDSILKEFSINKISHNKESNELGEKWVNIVKSQMHIKNFKSFPADMRILANLFNQAKINLYITEDQDLEKAVKFINTVRIRVVGEASNINQFKIGQFFKESRKALRRKK